MAFRDANGKGVQTKLREKRLLSMTAKYDYIYIQPNYHETELAI